MIVHQEFVNLAIQFRSDPSRATDRNSTEEFLQGSYSTGLDRFGPQSLMFLAGFLGSLHCLEQMTANEVPHLAIRHRNSYGRLETRWYLDATGFFAPDDPVAVVGHPGPTNLLVLSTEFLTGEFHRLHYGFQDGYGVAQEFQHRHLSLLCRRITPLAKTRRNSPLDTILKVWIREYPDVESV
jgi:hypothetical protein